MCLRSVEDVGDAVELGRGILAEDLLHDHQRDVPW